MSQKISLFQRSWDVLQFLLCLGIIGLLVLYLTREFRQGAPPRGEIPTTTMQEPDVPKKSVAADVSVVSDVSVIGLKSIVIRQDSPVFQELHIDTVNQTETTDPIVTVIGVNVASLQQSKANDTENSWGGVEAQPDFQFHSSALLTAFTDWKKAVADMAFAEKQLQLVEVHVNMTVEVLQQKVGLLEDEVKGGTEARKNLTVAEAELRQAEFEGQVGVLAAENTVRIARQNKTMYEKRLELEGLPLELLASISRDVDIIMAEVPESMIKHIKVGQICVAEFFTFPEKKFTGKVLSIVPVLSRELRLIRVLFSVDDADDLLHPGMFAEIGLGIDPRPTLQVPQDSVVPIDGLNYVLVRKSDTDWTITEVRLGKIHDSGVEVFSGIEDGDQIAGKGVILLKPIIAESLR